MKNFFYKLKRHAIHCCNEYIPHCILAIIFITSIILYNFTNNDFIKLILVGANSSSICILMTITTTEYWQNRKKRLETYEIRKSILIRSNYILGLIIEFWSGMVEYLIKNYEGDNIFSKKYYDIVSEKIDMTKKAPGAWRNYIEFYDSKRSSIISIINLWIQTYGSHMDPQLLSILSRIELCNMIQYNANMEYLNHNNWVADFFQKNAPKTGHKFYIEWCALENDFKLFSELETKINELKYEFSNDMPTEFYSLSHPIFKEKKSPSILETYNYDPFYNLASKIDIKMVYDRIDEHDNQLKFFMQSKWISPYKTETQKFMEALLAESIKLKEDDGNKQK